MFGGNFQSYGVLWSIHSIKAEVNQNLFTWFEDSGGLPILTVPYEEFIPTKRRLLFYRDDLGEMEYHSTISELLRIHAHPFLFSQKYKYYLEKMNWVFLKMTTDLYWLEDWILCPGFFLYSWFFLLNLTRNLLNFLTLWTWFIGIRTYPINYILIFMA